MNNDIIHKLEDIAIKMNNQHDRLERLLFGVELNLITCNKIEPEKNNIHKTISLNKSIRCAYELSLLVHRHNDITLANTTRGISLYIHLSIRSIASQQVNDKNTSEAHHQHVQAICSTYLFSYINIKKR